jgi:hypothetical protein
MDKDKKRAEEAEDRERMARIVKRHQKPAARKKTARPAEANQAPARIVREASEK